jgi:hypothetical protein
VLLKGKDVLTSEGSSFIRIYFLYFHTLPPNHFYHHQIFLCFLESAALGILLYCPALRIHDLRLTK